MADMIRRLVWFAIVAAAATFAIFVVLGNFATLGAASEGPVPIHDLVSSGSHRLSGMLLLPLSCDEISVRIQSISPNVYELAFQTWQDPSVQCPASPTPRLFQTIVLAPQSGVSFVATLDGKAFPISIIPDVAASTTP